MSLVHEYHFPQWKFSLYFMARLRDGETLGFKVPSAESEKFLWNYEGVTLELTHNWGTEDDPEYLPNNGNIEPHRGFGHIAFNVDDVDAYSQALMDAGVEFKKKPWEGVMKTIAFAYDPDKYWIEIVPRTKVPEGTSAEDAKKFYPGKENFSQTMFRVKDPKKALDFYCGLLGLHLVRVMHSEGGKFSNYFLANPVREGQTPFAQAEPLLNTLLGGNATNIPNYYPLTEGNNKEEAQSETAKKHVGALWRPVMELCHNWGTENDDSFAYHNGNDAPAGFGHTGFIVDDLQKAVEYFDSEKVNFRKRPETGMKGLAFILDDNKYSTEIIQRGLEIGSDAFSRPEKFQGF